MAQKDDQHADIAIIEEQIKTNTSSRGERLKKFSQAAVELEESPTENQSSKPKIQRVPFMLRDHQNFDKYYEPRIAAIGPFHHGQPKYELAEKVKLKLAASFVKGCSTSQNNITVEDLLRKIEENIKELRECYDEEGTKDYGDEALAWMLFVDGCWMLEFICKYDELETLFKIKSDQVSFVEQDMFLLENQLPYLVLTLLMSCSKREDLKSTLKKFVVMHGVASPEEDSAFSSMCKPKRDGEHTITVEEGREPTHLLDLFRTTMLGASSDIQEEIDGKRPTKEIEQKRNRMAQSFRNVQELHAAGIHFMQSGGKSLGDIYFKPFRFFYGFLQLPRIHVDDLTGPKFMNLIAYEMCPDFQNNFGVTSYIALLDSLIDHPEDVKHLRKERILHNMLGSDEEVSKLFNEIGTDLVPNNQIYRDVKAQIENHFQSIWKSWMAEFLHEHFSSPWSIGAFIGVLAGLVMTAKETFWK